MNSNLAGLPLVVEQEGPGQINPWPDGVILGKVLWKNTNLQHWTPAIGRGEFVHAEFMFKDSKKHADTHGWSWARWVGLDQQAFEKGPQVCTSCHTPVKDRDWH